MPANTLTVWSKQFEEIQQEHINEKKNCKPMWLETCIL